MQSGVRDHDERNAPFAVDAPEKLHDLPSPLAVEAARGLVEEDELGVGDERTRERHPLLFAARELTGEILKPVAYAEEVAHLAHGRGEILFLFPVEQKRQDDVFVRGEMRDEVVELVDKRNLSPAHGGELVVAHGGELPAREHDFALGGTLDAREDVKQGGLARAGLADHGDELPLGHGDVDAFQHLGDDIAHGIGLFDASGVKNGLAHRHLFFIIPYARTRLNKKTRRGKHEKTLPPFQNRRGVI